jgi:histone deacetylase 1/2
MTFRFSCPYTSSQNGKAERKIRTINNIIRTLLAHASLPPHFWHHALQMATYLLNIVPNKKLALQSPTKILYQRDPSYSHLKVFGCLCYPLIPSVSRNKLQSRSTPCVFLGYPSNHRGYKCYELSSRKIILRQHVLFDESTFPFSTFSTPPTSNYNFLDTSDTPFFNPDPISSHQMTPTPIQPSPNANATQLPTPISLPTTPTAQHIPSPTSVPPSSQTTEPVNSEGVKNTRRGG